DRLELEREHLERQGVELSPAVLAVVAAVDERGDPLVQRAAAVGERHGGHGCPRYTGSEPRGAGPVASPRPRNGSRPPAFSTASQNGSSGVTGRSSDPEGTSSRQRARSSSTSTSGGSAGSAGHSTAARPRLRTLRLKIRASERATTARTPASRNA